MVKVTGSNDLHNIGIGKRIFNLLDNVIYMMTENAFPH